MQNSDSEDIAWQTGVYCLAEVSTRFQYLQLTNQITELWHAVLQNTHYVSAWLTDEHEIQHNTEKGLCITTLYIW